MHAQIAERHPAVAAAMTHVDPSAEPRLERILAEMRTERRALRGLVPLVRREESVLVVVFFCIPSTKYVLLGSAGSAPTPRSHPD